jgi:YidC/Oxa1 family membrane protein insertase
MNLDQEKRVMIAFGLSFLMLIMWRVFFVKEPPPAPKKAASTSASPAQPGREPVTSAALSTGVASHPNGALPVAEGSKAEDIVIENKLYRVTISTQGAVVKSWVLKGYPKGDQLDLVDASACEKLGFPMSLSLPDATQTAQLNSALYVVEAAKIVPGHDPEKLSGANFVPPLTVAFTFSNGKVQARKQFSFGENYMAKVEISASDVEHPLPIEVDWPGGFGDQTLAPGVKSLVERAFYETADNSKVREVTLTPSFLRHFVPGGNRAGANDLEQDVSGPLVLAGLEDRFFAGVFLPDSADTRLRINREVWTPPDWQGEEKDKPKPLAVRLGNPTAKPLDFRLFVAPKDLDVLRAATPPLDSLVDFGWFSIIAKPIFLGLNFIYDHVIHNYGWAIVLLTLAINLATFPLRMRSIRSAQEMQRVAPIIKGIQDKYKSYKFNDPRKQKMNEEVMKVYSEHGINPLGSCLPMLLQMPFLYGFYRVLDLSIELRHAPWFGWLKDLAAPDPYYILPIIMVVTMFVLQRMTPMATADPSQKRMMMIMPLMFGFMFFRLASGLNLYYATSNMVGLVQQIYINRHMPPADPRLVPRKPPGAKE